MNLSASEELLTKYGVKNPTDIDPVAFANFENATIFYENPVDYKGYIVGVRDQAEFLINANLHSIQKRFAICHELGHWILHRKQKLICVDRKFDNFEAPTKAEFEANRFASELLIPSSMFRPLIMNLSTPTFMDVEKLSKIFNTSIELTAKRLVELSPHPLFFARYGQNENCKPQKSGYWPSYFEHIELPIPINSAFDDISSGFFGEHKPSFFPASDYFTGEYTDKVDVFCHLYKDLKNSDSNEHQILALISIWSKFSHNIGLQIYSSVES